MASRTLTLRQRFSLRADDVSHRLTQSHNVGTPCFRNHQNLERAQPFVDASKTRVDECGHEHIVEFVKHRFLDTQRPAFIGTGVADIGYDLHGKEQDAVTVIGRGDDECLGFHRYPGLVVEGFPVPHRLLTAA